MHARLIAIVVITAISLTGCNGAEKKAAESAAQAWLGKSDSLLETGKVTFRPGRGVLTTESTFKTSLREQLQAPPSTEKLSASTKASLEASLQRMRTLETFYLYVDAVVERYSAAKAAVADLASRATLKPLTERAAKFLEDEGDTLLEEATCDLAWNLMQPSEKESVNSTNLVRVYDAVLNLANLSLDAIVNALTSILQARFFKIFTRDDELVDFGMYAKDLYEKASTVTADGAQPIAYPGGNTTHALVQYARLCLRPPT